MISVTPAPVTRLVAADIVFIDELPKVLMDKVPRRELRARLLGRGVPEQTS
jgi:acyl-coenzyme A synthetase/AMP-(fatty) acid ligase